MPMLEPQRLHKNFRVGVSRRDQFRAIASIGVSGDGGIMIAPVAVRDQGWAYGNSQSPLSSVPSDIVATESRPKLHYHKSGIASVTLTGVELVRKQLRLPPISQISRGQILSLVAIRPWELKVGVTRRRDISSLHETWPQEVGWTFQVLRYPGELPALPMHTGPVGLFNGDDSRWFVDLSWYIPEALLVVHSFSGAATTSHLEPSITVAALGWSPDRSTANEQGVLGLWSAGLRNPQVAHMNPDQLLTERQLEQRLTGPPLNVGSTDEHTDRLYGARGRPRRE